MKEYGRIDWMSKSKVWKIIGYFKNKDIEVGRSVDHDTALIILKNWYQENKSVLK